MHQWYCVRGNVAIVAEEQACYQAGNF